MVVILLKCPYCGSENANKYGSNGKPRYMCLNAECTHKTFYADYKNKGYLPFFRAKIIQMATDGVGIRATARLRRISRNTVNCVLKKRKFYRKCNIAYFDTHTNNAYIERFGDDVLVVTNKNTQ